MTEKKQKKLPRIDHRYITYGQCEEDYVVHGMKIADISKRHSVPHPTIHRWIKDYKWDEQSKKYRLLRGQQINIVSKCAEKALKENADPKDIQLYKDLYGQLLATDPNMKPIPNKERLIIVKMVFDYMGKRHQTTVDRFLSEPEYDELVDVVVSF